jgi:hypothetical protein
VGVTGEEVVVVVVVVVVVIVVVVEEEKGEREFFLQFDFIMILNLSSNDFIHISLFRYYVKNEHMKSHSSVFYASLVLSVVTTAAPSRFPSICRTVSSEVQVR